MGASGFLGETNLLSGQTVFLTAVVTQPMRYIAVEREELKALLFEDGPLSDVLLVDVHRPPRGAPEPRWNRARDRRPALVEATRRLVDFVRRNRLPFVWHDTDRAERGGGARAGRGLRTGGAAARAAARRPGAAQPVDRRGLHGARDRARARAARGRRPARRRQRPGGLAAAVYGASEGLDTLVIESSALGGQAGTSRRIENYLGFPAGISGTELAVRAVTQARKFGARSATPYRAVALEPGNGRHLVRLDGGQEVSARAVVLATGADYRRLPVDGVE